MSDMNLPQGKPQVGEDYAKLADQLRDKPASKPEMHGNYAGESADQNKDGMKSRIVNPAFGEAQLAQTDGAGEPTSSAL